MVERYPDKIEVEGPIPSPPTESLNRDYPGKIEVEGPIPSAPMRFLRLANFYDRIKL